MVTIPPKYTTKHDTSIGHLLCSINWRNQHPSNIYAKKKYIYSPKRQSVRVSYILGKAVLVQVPPLSISAGHVVRVMSDDTPPSLHLTSPSYCAHLSRGEEMTSLFAGETRVEVARCMERERAWLGQEEGKCKMRYSS